jgi:hypothetical protein
MTQISGLANDSPPALPALRHNKTLHFFCLIPKVNVIKSGVLAPPMVFQKAGYNVITEASQPEMVFTA